MIPKILRRQRGPVPPVGPSSGWLVRDDRVLASIEVAVGRVAKAMGLLGRDNFDGAMVIGGRRSVHSFSMGFELDVAFLDSEGTVIRTLRLPRNRVTLPVWKARWVVEAEAGAFGEWELKVGDVLEIRLADGSHGSDSAHGLESSDSSDSAHGSESADGSDGSAGADGRHGSDGAGPGASPS